MVLTLFVLHIMLDHRPLSLIRILETLVIPESFLVELVLRKPQLIFNHNEEGKLEIIFSLVDDESRLLLFHVIFVF